jgi:hypothetical protein
MEEFETIIDYFSVQLNEKGSQVQDAKLFAIGKRMEIEGEIENRLVKQTRLGFQINQRQQELDRFKFVNSD